MTADAGALERSRRDPWAFEPLVSRHSAAIHAYLARRTLPGIADDLLAEVWLAAFTGRASFDPIRGEVRGWLFGIARNVLAGHRRDAQRREVTTLSSGAADRIDDWACVDERLDAAAVGPQLREALRELSPPDRELMLLVAWEQLTPSEAAAALGIPAGTARSRLHRARTLLRQQLDPATTPRTLDTQKQEKQG